MQGLLIGTIIYILFGVILFKILKNRKTQKYDGITNKTYTIIGIVLREDNNALDEAVVTFSIEGDVKISTINSDVHIESSEISKFNIPITASLATSHIFIRTTNNHIYRMFNDVTKKMLMRKTNAVYSQNLASAPVSDVDALLQYSTKGTNPYYTSDNHTKFHQWLEYNKFPNYSSQIMASDLVGFVIIMLLPTMLLAGIWIEKISSAITGSPSLGTAIMGWLVIVSLFSVGFVKIYMSYSLRKKLKNAYKNTSN